MEISQIRLLSIVQKPGTFFDGIYFNTYLKIELFKKVCVALTVKAVVGQGQGLLGLLGLLGQQHCLDVGQDASERWSLGPGAPALLIFTENRVCQPQSSN